jgi:predicted transcriptional regulator
MVAEAAPGISRSMTTLLTLTERHYSVKEIGDLWQLSPAAIRRLFRNEPGVLRFGKEKRGHQRDYVTLRIPASVAERVYRRSMRPGFVPSAEQDKMNVGV